jgi:hypothetical protein
VNTFATLERLSDFQFEKVKYFSIRFEENEVNEFFDFLNRMEEIEEIDEQFRLRNINWNYNQTDIVFNNNLEIEL